MSSSSSSKASHGRTRRRRNRKLSTTSDLECSCTLSATTARSGSRSLGMRSSSTAPCAGEWEVASKQRSFWCSLALNWLERDRSNGFSDISSKSIGRSRMLYTLPKCWYCC